MHITEEQFVSALAESAPEARTVLDEHVEENGEVLIHVLVARLRDLAVDAFHRGDRTLSERLVTVFDAGLRNGDERVENAVAVAVSFVEDSQPWDSAQLPYVATWPEALRAEAERQAEWQHRRR